MIFRIVLFVLFFVSLAFAQVDKFQYQPDKIKTGIIYHYVKTNIDGSVPENISIYVASKDRLEVFKFHEPRTRAGYVVAEMDWKNFQASTLLSYAALSATEQPLAAKLKFLVDTRKMEVEIPAQDKPLEIIDFGFLPVHLYNFDFTSLNFAFRHLKDPTGEFKVGVADPTFAEKGPGVRYRGEVTVKYVGEEKRNGKDCRKYRIDGAGLENRGGFLWVNKSEGHFEDAEIALPDNPNWSSFKFLLKKIEPMTAEQWVKFRTDHFK